MRYAGFWIRFLAYIIDGVILLGINLILLLVAAATGSWLGTVIGVIYYIGFWAWQGQTPGKMVVGIKVIQVDGSPIGFGRAVLRYIGYWVSAIIILIGFIMIGFDDRKQGLHDKIAGTLVVKTG
jgi:uncharacterized RDD family membrane protein YckC